MYKNNKIPVVIPKNINPFFPWWKFVCDVIRCGHHSYTFTHQSPWYPRVCPPWAWCPSCWGSSPSPQSRSSLHREPWCHWCCQWQSCLLSHSLEDLLQDRSLETIINFTSYVQSFPLPKCASIGAILAMSSTTSSGMCPTHLDRASKFTGFMTYEHIVGFAQ